jgi:glycosyltransferase involved in cell wall biosynthesis
MRLYVISNMFPSKESESFGIFVKKTNVSLQNNGIVIKRETYLYGKTSNNFVKLIRYFSFYYKISYSYFKNDYDYIYIHYPPYIAPIILLLLKFKKKGILINFHGGDVFPQSKIEEKLMYFTRKLVSKSKIIVVPSQFFKTTVEKKFCINSQKILIYPSGGIDNKVFYKDEKISQKTNNSDFDLILGYVSRIEKGKGWNIFIDCVEELTKHGLKVSAIVVGNGSEYHMFRKKCLEKNILDYFHFKGELNHSELRKVYNQIDIFAFTTTLPESLGLVALEAMACQCMVIASEVGAIPNYIKDSYNGYLFSSKDSQMLTKKILKYYYLNSSEKELLKINALKTASEYFTEVCTMKFITSIKEKID